jgi:hypothetical protein
LLVTAVPVLAAGLLIVGITRGGGDHVVVVSASGGTPALETAAPTVAVRSLAPVSVGKASELVKGLAVSVQKVSPVTVKAQGPGGLSGPGVTVALEVKNDTGTPFDLNSLSVNASFDRGTPAVPGDSDPAKPFKGRLESGQSASSVYVFVVPKSKIGTLKVEVSSGSTANIAIFTA